MPTNNQNQENASGRMDQDKPQQTGGNKKEESFENPQEGEKWDNYQTRTLSSDTEGAGNKISKEEVEEAFRSTDKDGNEKA